MNDVNDLKNYFNRHGYVLYKNCISDDLIKYLNYAVRVLMQRNVLETSLCDITPLVGDYPKETYGNDFTELLLPTIKNYVEEVTCKNLIPTYSFLRIYKDGCELKRHTDRFSCEYSVTLTLSNTTDTKWPFFVKSLDYSENTNEIFADVGDLIVYQGINVPHWREKFSPKNKSGTVTQVFLHYVDLDGPFADYAYDKRESWFIR